MRVFDKSAIAGFVNNADLNKVANTSNNSLIEVIFMAKIILKIRVLKIIY